MKKERIDKFAMFITTAFWVSFAANVPPKHLYTPSE